MVDARPGNGAERLGGIGTLSDRDFSAEVGAHHRFASTAITHPGARRKRNEDSYASSPAAGVWVVADGVGGYTAGDYASRTVTEALGSLPADSDAAGLLVEVR